MFMALACDFRVMSNENGWMSLNEARIGIPLNSDYAMEFFR